MGMALHHVELPVGPSELRVFAATATCMIARGRRNVRIFGIFVAEEPERLKIGAGGIECESIHSNEQNVGRDYEREQYARS